MYSVMMPSRFIRQNVGGNTTYARTLMKGYQRRGVPVGLFNSGRGVLGHIAFESAEAVRSRKGSLVHFVADTGPLVKCRTPSVVTVQGVASRWISTARTPAQDRLWRFRVAAAISSTQRVITGSQSSADDISAVFEIDRDRIEIIPHGIEHDTFATAEQVSPEVASKLPPEYLLYLGNIEPRKNIVELVRALELEPLKSMAIPLVIAGKPAWNFEESMDAIQGSTRVTYLGFVSSRDRAALLQHCSMFVFPSLYEGFGFPPLEAMAAGAPVAASRRGSLAEVAGPAYPIHDISAEGISQAVSEALSSHEWLSSAPAAGREWVKAFDWEKSTDQHLRIYEEVLGESASASRLQ